MNDIECTDLEHAVARLVIAAMRSVDPLTFEYRGAEKALYVYYDGIDKKNVPSIPLTHDAIDRIKRARTVIKTNGEPDA